MQMKQRLHGRDATSPKINKILIRASLFRSLSLSLSLSFSLCVVAEGPGPPKHCFHAAVSLHDSAGRICATAMCGLASLRLRAVGCYGA